MRRKNNKKLKKYSQELRKNMTPEEKHLWYDYLKKCPYIVNRQKVLGKYIVDFYCAEAKLVIEIDGSQHGKEDNRIYDSQRSDFLQGYSLKVIRFTNEQINKQFYAVCRNIEKNIVDRINEKDK